MTILDELRDKIIIAKNYKAIFVSLVHK